MENSHDGYRVLHPDAHADNARRTVHLQSSKTTQQTRVRNVVGTLSEHVQLCRILTIINTN